MPTTDCIGTLTGSSKWIMIPPLKSPKPLFNSYELTGPAIELLQGLPEGHLVMLECTTRHRQAVGNAVPLPMVQPFVDRIYSAIRNPMDYQMEYLIDRVVWSLDGDVPISE